MLLVVEVLEDLVEVTAIEQDRDHPGHVVDAEVPDDQAVCKNRWTISEWAGEGTPDGMQNMVGRAK